MTLARKKRQEQELGKVRFLSVAERLAQLRQEREAKLALSAKLTAAPKRRK